MAILASSPHIVRTLEPEDASALAAYYRRNREQHQEWSPIVSETYYTRDFQLERLRLSLDARLRGKEFRFGIFPPEQPGLLIGTITLTAIERGVFQNGRFGYSMDHEHQGRGIMSSALALVVDYAVAELGLHRLEANVMPRNSRSARVLQNCGFVKVGHSPRMIFINGTWEGHDMYARLADEVAEDEASV